MVGERDITTSSASDADASRHALRGRVALITGASSGLGEAIASRLAERGARLTLAARRADQVETLAERLRGMGADVLGISGDIRDAVFVERMVRETVERWGRLDVLIANAGLGYRAPIAEGDPARWKQVLDVNVFGLLLTLRFGVPPMLDHGGDVVVMSSVAGRVIQAGNGVYSASKQAVNAIAETLRQEVTRQGVRVTVIEPGVVRTAFQENAGYDAELRKRLLEDQRPLTADDIASAVLFVLEAPAHLSVNELLIRPTDQVSA